MHVLLVLLVSCQVLFYLGKDINHAHCSSQHFSRLFLGTPKGSLVLYEPQELQEAVRKAVTGIFEINNNTFNDVKLVVNGVIFPDTLPMKLRYRNQSTEVLELSGAKIKDKMNSKEYLVQALPVLYNNDIRYLEDISIQFGLVEVVHQPIRKTPFMLFIAPLVRTRSEESHFAWNLTTTFDGTAVGRFVGSLSYSLRVSQNDNASFSHSGLHVCVMCLAGLSIVLILRKVWRSIVILHRMYGASKRIQDELSPSEQLAVFNLWWGVSLLSHFFQLWATIYAMEKAPDVSARVARVGWSCFFTWVNICQYFESFPGYYVMFSTTSKGLISICRYMLSVLPILTGFMFLGTCQFWKVSAFQNVQATYASLFSLLNGDMVHDTFDDLGSLAGWYGHAYVYVFIFIFIYIVLNVNITIIEEAYFAARYQGMQQEAQLEHAKQVPTPPSHQPSCADQLETSVCTPGSDRTTPQAQRCVSLPPNVASWSNSSPLLDGSRPKSEILMKGKMSPRFLENPRLQGALAATFPGDLFVTGYSKSWRSMGTPSMQADPSRQSFNDISPASTPSHCAEMDWWLRELPHWTATLRTKPLPRRSIVCDEVSWQRLQKLLAEHSNVCMARATEMYAELGRA